MWVHTAVQQLRAVGPNVMVGLSVWRSDELGNVTGHDELDDDGSGEVYR